MRVQLIDPSADVLPYDHGLASALARRGVDVDLLTSRFVHGPAPEPDGYAVSETFYRLATGPGARRPRLRRVLKGAGHVAGMRRVARRAAELSHWQWMWLEALSMRLLPGARPQVLTLHNVLRRGRSARRLLDAMDAIIVHTRHGAELLGGGERVHVIPHGAFDHLTRQAGERPLPPDLARVEGPVVLCFGVLRPYKGVDVLLEAFRSVEGAELWIVGRPLGVSLEPEPGVRMVPRYVSDAELPAFFRRADLLVLPHRSVDASGVLFAGLAFGKAMVLSDVGGFRELVAEHGVGLLVPPGDPAALGAAIGGLLADPAERERLAGRARAAAAGPLSWDSVAARTIEVYEEVLAG